MFKQTEKLGIKVCLGHKIRSTASLALFFIEHTAVWPGHYFIVSKTSGNFNLFPLLLLLLLSCFSRVQLCATPEMAAHQAPQSLGYSRQEHWSGLPFPSPMQQSEKWKGSCSVVSDSSQPQGLQPTRLLCPWDFPGKSTGVGCYRLLHYFLEVRAKANTYK